MKYNKLTIALLMAVSCQAVAEQQSDIEHIQIISHNDKLRTEAGSATLIGEAQLEQFEFDDIHRILSQVPGVNIREEDGFGLRPNIGFRGVTPERSKKITILEDGVLIGPAPYSAPAAYYFPLTTRMTAVEVFKGPAAIHYGPQTVAGTLNLVSRQVPDDASGMLDVSAGSDGYKKAHAYYGNREGQFGFLVEGVHLESDGFKELDGAQDTGFEKDDLLVKLDYKLDGEQFKQRFELKLAYSDELSNETYLGLTEDDYSENPYRRYAASGPANMDTKHTQVMFTHQLSTDNFALTTRAYRNDFERAWLKLNSVTNSSGSLSDILADPTRFEREYSVISGQADSVQNGESNVFLTMGTNDRAFFSQGIQFDGDWQVAAFGLDHSLSFGVRFHQDEIERDHFEDTYAMVNAVNTRTDTDSVFTTQNTESTDAWSVYIEDKVTFDKLTLGVGVRGELMDMSYQNDSPGKENDWQNKSSRIWLPGLSGFYQLSENAGLLFGVHQGFVPSSPSSPVREGDDEFEKSVNYEFGGRYNDGNRQIEVVSFFNDYSNLVESCGQSNCGIENEFDREFSGGEVDVWGVESQFAQTFSLNESIDIPVRLTYTYTQSEFKEELFSEFTQWGHIRPGDHLPYLPNHQAALSLGLAHNDWSVDVLIKYTSDMPEAAGVAYSAGEVGNTTGNDFAMPLAGVDVPSTTVVDIAARYELDQYGHIYAKVDNLFDQDNIVSRRPYGARPGKPRSVAVGYKYQF
ncbi:TonB-dependent receptor domain-containing protein [Pseudoalteromonas sp. P1-7a]|uniref:TonB-dependent receptor family protein n=1 Tax=Pseudoalteromonas sp. P1-7a TaxID=1723755 RepID=UPI0006D666F4|nr:TonB-dependent receptor [Pseudoalteromonas sp. P1-7a]KPZ60947.1 Fe(3+) dicitrate transport protein FecA precursor [Pseudoalteromonas sp. P1-7a]